MNKYRVVTFNNQPIVQPINANIIVDSKGKQLYIYHDIVAKNWKLIDIYTGLYICKDKTKKAVIDLYESKEIEKYHNYIKNGYTKNQELCHREIEKYRITHPED